MSGSPDAATAAGPSTITDDQLAARLAALRQYNEGLKRILSSPSSSVSAAAAVNDNGSAVESSGSSNDSTATAAGNAVSASHVERPDPRPATEPDRQTASSAAPEPSAWTQPAQQRQQPALQKRSASEKDLFPASSPRASSPSDPSSPAPGRRTMSGHGLSPDAQATPAEPSPSRSIALSNAESEHLRALLDGAEVRSATLASENETLRSQLISVMEGLSKSEDRIRDLERRNLQLQSEGQRQFEEMSALLSAAHNRLDDAVRESQQAFQQERAAKTKAELELAEARAILRQRNLDELGGVDTADGSRSEVLKQLKEELNSQARTIADLERSLQVQEQLDAVARTSFEEQIAIMTQQGEDHRNQIRDLTSTIVAERELRAEAERELHVLRMNSRTSSTEHTEILAKLQQVQREKALLHRQSLDAAARADQLSNSLRELQRREMEWEKYAVEMQRDLERALSENGTLLAEHGGSISSRISQYLEKNAATASLQERLLLLDQECREAVMKQQSAGLQLEEASNQVRILESEVRRMTMEKEAAERIADSLRASMKNSLIDEEELQHLRTDLQVVSEERDRLQVSLAEAVADRQSRIREASVAVDTVAMHLERMHAQSTQEAEAILSQRQDWEQRTMRQKDAMILVARALDDDLLPEMQLMRDRIASLESYLLTLPVLNSN